MKISQVEGSIKFHVYYAQVLFVIGLPKNVEFEKDINLYDFPNFTNITAIFIGKTASDLDDFDIFVYGDLSSSLVEETDVLSNSLESPSDIPVEA